ncbi:MAG TPA: polysaccharide biosynthesis/export family protein [Polyangiaceae bacterium]|nr:polysaccharide biosynthesis/export family protein [Polyangiaceae bacterium]
MKSFFQFLSKPLPSVVRGGRFGRSAASTRACSRACHAVLIGALVAGAAFETGCASDGQYVWFTRVPRSTLAPPNEYIIGIGDSISIEVYQQKDMSLKGRVRRDGRLAMPLLNEVVAAGKTPAALAKELEGRLKQYLQEPRVTVNVEEATPISVTILGEVKSGGTLTLEPPASMLQAMAKAGGLSEYGDHDRIFLLRKVPQFQRIRFTYDAIMNNESGAAMFPLQSGDVIVVQ